MNDLYYKNTFKDNSQHNIIYLVDIESIDQSETEVIETETIIETSDGFDRVQAYNQSYSFNVVFIVGIGLVFGAIVAHLFWSKLHV